MRRLRPAELELDGPLGAARRDRPESPAEVKLRVVQAMSGFIREWL